jgi:hypothetical protein
MHLRRLIREGIAANHEIFTEVVSEARDIRIKGQTT